jgi:hypothetical protein
MKPKGPLSCSKGNVPPPTHTKLQLPTLILRALTHFTFCASTLILSSRLGFRLPNDFAPSGFRPEIFSINTSQVFRHAQNDLLQRWLVSAYFWAIIRRPKPVIFVINYVVCEWTAVDTFNLYPPPVVPYNLVPLKSFIYQLMHNRVGSVLWLHMQPQHRTNHNDVF